MALAKQPSFALGALLYEVATGGPPICGYGYGRPDSKEFDGIEWQKVEVRLSFLLYVA